MHDVFEVYLHSLREDRDDKTELSDRGALETLLKAAAKQANPQIRIIHEAKKVRGKGGPDFKAMKQGMILGYVEDKPSARTSIRFSSPIRSLATSSFRKIFCWPTTSSSSG